MITSAVSSFRPASTARRVRRFTFDLLGRSWCTLPAITGLSSILLFVPILHAQHTGVDPAGPQRVAAAGGKTPGTGQVQSSGLIVSPVNSWTPNPRVAN